MGAARRHRDRARTACFRGTHGCRMRESRPPCFAARLRSSSRVSSSDSRGRCSHFRRGRCASAQAAPSMLVPSGCLVQCRDRGSATAVRRERSTPGSRRSQVLENLVAGSFISRFLACRVDMVSTRGSRRCSETSPELVFSLLPHQDSNLVGTLPTLALSPWPYTVGLTS